jgi:hypothetical protein
VAALPEPEDEDSDLEEDENVRYLNKIRAQVFGSGIKAKVNKRVGGAAARG